MIENVAYFSELGDREINQDAVYASAGENRGIFVVADGMGGHAGGEIASGAIVNGIKKWWESNAFAAAQTTVDQTAEQCRHLLRNINAEVFSGFHARGEMGGSTVAVLILWDDRYVTLSAGDSRIYRRRGRTLEQLTTDDVWENLPEVKYAMSDEKAALDPRYGRLTEALGSEERLKIRSGGGMLSDRELFLLCSDGVYKYCSGGDLEKILCGGVSWGGVVKRTEELRRRVAGNVGKDNYSAVVCSARKEGTRIWRWKCKKKQQQKQQ